MLGPTSSLFMFFQDLLSVSVVKFVNDFVQMFSIFIDFWGGGYAGIGSIIISEKTDHVQYDCEFLLFRFLFYIFVVKTFRIIVILLC